MKQPIYFTHLIFILLILWESAVTSRVQAQTSSCLNADFELNNFTGWQGTTGSCCPINSTVPGLVATRHTIMTGPGTDPNTNGVLKVVAPGGQYSARLGNDNVGAEAEQLIYSFPVSPNNQLFIYRYAVVLEDPFHDSLDQPRFEIKVFAQNGNTIGCGVYNVYAAAGIPGFVTIQGPSGSEIHWKDWTTVGIDLSGYVGQTVTIVFSTGDCALGGHFGYAYIDCFCYPFNIFSDFCPGISTTTMTAPPGFAQYLWNTGQTTQSIVVNNPVVGDTFSVVMTSVTGCDVTLYSVVTPSVIASAYIQSDSCYNSVAFLDSSYVVVGSPVNYWYWDFGDGTSSNLQNPVHSYAAPGNYTTTLIIGNSGGCRDTVLRNIVANDAPAAAFNFTPTCTGTPLQFTDASLSPSSGIASWQWNFGDGSTVSSVQHPVHTYSLPGTYNTTLIVQDANSCRDTIVTAVNTLATPLAGFTYTTTCANNTVNFTYTTVVVNGTLAGFVWDFGDGIKDSTNANPVHAYTIPGIYTVTLFAVSNDNCRDTAQQQVNLIALPTVNFTSSDTCAQSPVQFIDGSGLSGGTITAWTWNFGDGSPISNVQNPLHNYNSIGTYSVSLTVTASNGCNNSLVKNVTIKPSPVADFTAPVACPGVQFSFNNITLFPSGSINSYTWDFGDGITSGVVTPSHTYNTGGNYIVSLVAVANNGCSDTLIKYVNTAATPIAAFTVPSGCPGLPVNFTSQSTINSGSIQTTVWNFGDGSLNDSITATPHIFINAGSFNVLLTAISNNGCRNSVVHEVSIPTPPVASFSAPSICMNDTMFFSDQSSNIPSLITGWNWNFGDGSPTSSIQNPYHIYNNDTTYTVRLIVTNSRGCIDTVTSPVTVKTIPQVLFNYSVLHCEGIPIQFTDSTIFPGTIQTYSWNFADSTPVSILQDPFHTFTEGGYYTVSLTVMAANGCRDDLSSLIYINHTPRPDFSFSNVCIYDAAQFTDATISGNGPINGWQWNFGDGFNANGTSTPSHTFANAGSYLVTLVATATTGCYNDTTKQIIVYPKPNASFTHDTICMLSAAAFNDHSSVTTGSISAWQWNFGDNSPIDFNQNTLHFFNDDTTYIVTLIVNSDNLCADTTSQMIITHPLPVVDFTTDTVCLHESTSFINQSLIANGIIQLYHWSFGDSTVSTLLSPTHIYAAAGLHYPLLTATSDLGCKDSILKPAYVYDLPQAILTSDVTVGCQPLAIQFQDQSTSAEGVINHWEWDYGDGNGDTLQDPGYSYQQSGVYSVALSVSTDIGCHDEIEMSDYITVFAKPVAAFSYEPEKASILHPTVYFSDHSWNVVTWNYLFGDSATSTESFPEHTYTAPGFYTVTQEVTSPDGCKDTVVEIIEIEGAFTVYVPNTFTPNNDGRNDVFNIYGIGISEYQLMIFNRWGKLLFTTNSTSHSWDGTYANTSVPEDTYVYLLKIKDVFDKPHSLTGQVNLVY